MVDHMTAQMSDRGSDEIIIFSGKLQRYNCICTRNKKENKDKRLEYPVTPISEEEKVSSFKN